MLTSPVNVTIAAASGAGLKSNTATSDNNARREPPHVPVPPGQAAETVIEPELPSNSPLGHVNAAAATVANRTVLQELTLNIATMLRIPRRPDENLTQLFLRIIATIEAMSQADRLAFEMRAGLKPLKITLTDLLMALRKPDGLEAARLTAMAEAPTSVPGHTVANAATTTYLEDGTDTGHTEETLAMRAAARNSAAGQSVFSAESKVRPEAAPADAKVLQNQLKSMFEPGQTGAAPTPENVAKHVVADPAIIAEPAEHAEQAVQAERAEVEQAPLAKTQAAARETLTISSANLKLDQPTLDKIRNVAQAIAGQAPEATRADPERPNAEKAEAGDHRMQTLLTLKGFAEAVSTIPAKAAELLASVVAEVSAPLIETADGTEPQDKRALALPMQESAELELPEFPPASEELVADAENRLVTTGAIDAESQDALVVPPDENVGGQPETALSEDRQAAAADRQPLSRHDLTQHAVPFAYAPVQPAREDQVKFDAEESVGDEDERREEEDDDEDGEKRRPRDEYDEIRDPVPEEEPAIVINRDSSEADRAFALYQRMGGF